MKCMRRLASAVGAALPVAAASGLSIMGIAGCGAAATQSPPGRHSTLVCSVSPNDDPCDLCEAQKCCSEQTACAADSDCEAADDELDACEARAAKAGQTVARCYAAFRAAGAIASTRAHCLEANCNEQCL